MEIVWGKIRRNTSLPQRREKNTPYLKKLKYKHPSPTKKILKKEKSNPPKKIVLIPTCLILRFSQYMFTAGSIDILINTPTTINLIVHIVLPEYV